MRTTIKPEKNKYKKRHEFHKTRGRNQHQTKAVEESSTTQRRSRPMQHHPKGARKETEWREGSTTTQKEEGKRSTTQKELSKAKKGEDELTQVKCGGPSSSPWVMLHFPPVMFQLCLFFQIRNTICKVMVYQNDSVNKFMLNFQTTATKTQAKSGPIGSNRRANFVVLGGALFLSGNKSHPQSSSWVSEVPSPLVQGCCFSAMSFPKWCCFSHRSLRGVWCVFLLI